MTLKTLEGVYPPHVTPFDRRGEIDGEALRELIEFWLDAGLHGLVTCASNGEGPYLTLEERREVISIVLDSVDGRPVIAGVAAPGTREVMRQIRDAVDLGVDAILLTPPFYYTPNSCELLRHYQLILGKFDVPTLLYNVPKFVGYNIDIEIIVELVEEFDHVIGIKDSSGLFWRISELTRLVGDKISILAGTGDLLLPTLLMGGKGGIVGVSIIAPEMCIKLFNAFKRGDLITARDLQWKLTRINEVIIKRYNQLSAVKEALRLLGKPGGYPRPPSLPLEEAERRKIQGVLREVGLCQ